MTNKLDAKIDHENRQILDSRYIYKCMGLQSLSFEFSIFIKIGK